MIWKKMGHLELMRDGSDRLNMGKLLHLAKTKLLYFKKGDNTSILVFKLFSCLNYSSCKALRLHDTC